MHRVGCWILAIAGACAIPEKHLNSGMGAFGTPTQLSITIAGADDYPTLTDDMLELYFGRSSDIYVSKRPTVNDQWETPAIVTEVSTAAKETSPEVSPDGLTLYFASDAAGGPGGYDIWISKRVSRSAPWGTATLVSELNSAEDEKAVTPGEDSDLIVLASARVVAQDYDLYMSTKQGSGQWTTPSLIANVNSTTKDSGPMLSANRLSLYFYTDRNGPDELMVATRTDTDAEFSAPVEISELNGAEDDANPWISPDGATLYFSRNNALFKASR